MELTDIRCVVAVADHGSFTAAARALGYAQPSLSRRVAGLERELGTPLFHRLGREIAVTPAGEVFLTAGRRALFDAEIARAGVAEVIGLQGGELAVAALPTLVVTHLAPVAGEFRRRHPNVILDLLGAEDSATISAMLASARCEIGVAELPFSDALAQTRLLDQELLAVFPPGTELTTPDRVSAAELADLPIVITPEGTSTRLIVEELFARAGVIPNFAVETTQRDAMVPLTLTGAGATFISTPLAEQAAASGAVTAHLEPPLLRPIGAAVRPGPLTPAAAEFLRILVERSDGGYDDGRDGGEPTATPAPTAQRH
jgi:DNA-binding transcriptional LysR family regulator